jgi:hypothetical protein
VTILGRGDLSPPRRYRPGGRRRRRWFRAFVILLLLAALAAGGWYAWRHLRTKDSATVRTLPTTCPSSSHPQIAVPPPPQARPVRVLNGNLRPGLARRVAHALRAGPARLPIGRVGNAARFIHGPSRVSYPPALIIEAQHVAAALLPEPRLVETASATTVQLELGTGFRRAATAGEYRSAVQAFGPLPSPTASPSVSASSCATP